MFASKCIFNTGSRQRNPHLAKHLSFLKETESWSFERLKAYQLNRCKQLLQFANSYSSYYRNLFEKYGLSVEGFSDLDDLKRIPVTTKQDLIDQNSEVHTTENHRFKKLFECETSGSTGQPLTFKRDEPWDSWNRAAYFRGYSWHGVQPWERNGYFWGYNIAPSKKWKTRLLDASQNRFRVFSYKRDELIGFIKKLEKASYLHGYSSMIYEAARIINDSDMDTSRLNLKLVKGTSEKIYDHYQPEVKKAFGRRMVSEYGAAEAGIIAFECPHGSMHLNMEGCIVEEEEGEIIVTNLNAYSFPIIRYKLGDAIKLENQDHTCPCGMKHPVLNEVTGRVGQQIFGKSQTYPSLTIYYVFKNIYFESGVAVNGQFVQHKKGHITVKIEDALSHKKRSLLEKQLHAYFGTDMEWNFEENALIHALNGKRKDFISEIKQ